MSNIIPSLVIKHEKRKITYFDVVGAMHSRYCSGCFKIKDQCSILTNCKISYIQRCPCIDCIVKPVCDTYCDLRAKLFQDLVVNEIEVRTVYKKVETS